MLAFIFVLTLLPSVAAKSSGALCDALDFPDWRPDHGAEPQPAETSPYTLDVTTNGRAVQFYNPESIYDVTIRGVPRGFLLRVIDQREQDAGNWVVDPYTNECYQQMVCSANRRFVTHTVTPCTADIEVKWKAPARDSGVEYVTFGLTGLRTRTEYWVKIIKQLRVLPPNLQQSIVPQLIIPHQNIVTGASAQPQNPTLFPGQIQQTSVAGPALTPEQILQQQYLQQQQQQLLLQQQQLLQQQNVFLGTDGIPPVNLSPIQLSSASQVGQHRPATAVHRVNPLELGFISTSTEQQQFIAESSPGGSLVSPVRSVRRKQAENGVATPDCDSHNDSNIEWCVREVGRAINMVQFCEELGYYCEKSCCAL